MSNRLHYITTISLRILQIKYFRVMKLTGFGAVNMERMVDTRNAERILTGTPLQNGNMKDGMIKLKWILGKQFVGMR